MKEFDNIHVMIDTTKVKLCEVSRYLLLSIPFLHYIKFELSLELNMWQPDWIIDRINAYVIALCNWLAEYNDLANPCQAVNPFLMEGWGQIKGYSREKKYALFLGYYSSFNLKRGR